MEGISAKKASQMEISIVIFKENDLDQLKFKSVKQAQRFLSVQSGSSSGTC